MMEAWLVFAIISQFLYALTNVADKHFLTEKFKKPIVYALTGGLFQIIILFSIFFLGFSLPPLPVILICLLTGALFFLTIPFYFKAYSIEDVSVVVPLGSFSPLLVFVLSVIFLNEKLGTNEILSILFILVGGFLIVTKEINFKKIVLTPALKFLIISWVIYAIAAVLMKYAYSNVSIIEGFILIRTGSILACVMIIIGCGYGNEIKKQFSSMSTNYKKIYIGNQMLGIMGMFFVNLAVSIGSVSMVSAISGMQGALVLLLVMLFSIFYPKIIKETMDKKTLLKKVIGITLIGISLYLMNS